MQIKPLSLMACLAVVSFASTANAGNMTQPATNGVSLFAYDGVESYCPAGTQPVMWNGAVSCCKPNATGYQSHPVVVRKARTVRHVPQTRIPMGKSPNSWDGS